MLCNCSKRKIPDTKRVGVLYGLTDWIDNAGKSDTDSQDFFIGNSSSLKKFPDFLIDSTKIRRFRRKFQLASLIFQDRSGQIQKQNPQMIPGNIQTDSKM